MTLIVTFMTEHAELVARYEGLLARMRECGAIEVSTIVGSLAIAPATGFILYAGEHSEVALADVPGEQRGTLAERLVGLGVSQGGMRDELEQLHLAGAIDMLSLIEWERSPNRSTARGLFGLKEIAPVIGATCLRFPFPSEHYCYFSSDQHRGLPHLLVDYLRALHERSLVEK